MKKTLSKVLAGVVGVAIAGSLWSCSAESPFSEQEGSGELRLKTVVDNIVTRADESRIADEQQTLRDSCVVYISKVGAEKGKSLLYKYKGLENVPEAIRLNPGLYVAEAWSGDSVSASFDKKFYRGYMDFNISNNDVSNVVLDCKIKNVVVSVNTAASTALNANLMDLNSYKVVVKTKAGSLEFTNENAETAKGYFMLSKKDTIGGVKPSMEWEISGKRKDGVEFSKNGVISNVEQAHHYLLNFEYKPGSSSDSEMGAAFIQLKIEDENLNNGSQTVVGPPSFSGLDFEIEKQQVYTDESVPEMVVKVCGYGKLSELYVTSESTALGLPATPINIIGNNSLAAYNDAGLTWSDITYKSSTNLSTMYLTFSSEMLSKLSPNYEKEHKITLRAKDERGYESSADLRIARNENAVVIEDAIVFDKIADSDMMAVRARHATLTYTLADSFTGVPGVEYRKAGSGDWTFVPVETSAAKPRATRASSVKGQITITDLEQGTTYEYRGACDGWSDTKKTYRFTTESIFSIPNASFELWSTYQASTMLGTKTVILPGSEGDKTLSFWGSGNEGAATANMTLTDKSTDMKHSGTYSARLESKSAMGVIAAGNLFVGEYVKTDGTNGVLSVGRKFNGTHPAALQVWANYRPGSKVSIKSGNEQYCPGLISEGPDHGQIYVALTTEPVEIRTNPSDRKLFNRDDPQVIAYGQVSWEGTGFGPDGQLQLVNIPLEYKDNVKTDKPTHLVIVCSASKFGDYFSGSTGSTMYLDDFELIYE